MKGIKIVNFKPVWVVDISQTNESEGRDVLPALVRIGRIDDERLTYAGRVPATLTPGSSSSWPRRTREEATNATVRIVTMTPRLANAGIL
jgi:hypothetical protein